MIESFEKYYSTIDEIVERVNTNIESKSVSSLSDVLMNMNKHYALNEKAYRYDSFFVKQQRILAELIKIVDIDFSFLLEELITVNDYRKEKETSIFCVFRYGPFFHAPTALKKVGCEFDIVADFIKSKDVVSWKGKEEMKNDSDEALAVKNIPSKGAGFMLNMYKSLKKGRSVILYIDQISNKGNKEKKIPIELMNLKALFDKSIFDISKKLKVKIVPVLAEWTQTFKIKVNIFNSIDYDFNNGNYAEYCMKSCYDHLNKALDKDYYQWIGWDSIHDIINLKDVESYNPQKQSLLSNIKNIKIRLHPKLKFNNEIYQICKDEKYHIISIYTYKLFEIPETAFAIIEEIISKGMMEASIIKKAISFEIFTKLIKNKILIYN